jgi:hypothetical protein
MVFNSSKKLGRLKIPQLVLVYLINLLPHVVILDKKGILLVWKSKITNFGYFL